MTDPIELLIGASLSGAFANPIMLGLAGLALLTIFGVALRLCFEAFVVVMLAFTFLLVTYGGLPPVTLYALLFGCGFIIFMAITRMVKH